ncbi:MAG: hypothetical protein JW772_00930 [Candidatus Diapherotrites archaeon]|nr:hypothetical protein [Candidatus Diapherotrites archaeon]
MGSRENEIAELYSRIRGQHILGITGMNRRIITLMQLHTPYNSCGLKEKLVIAVALASGATLDSKGKLVLNDYNVRQTLLKRGLVKNLARNPEKLISPETTAVEGLFASVRALGSAQVEYPGLRARKERRVPRTGVPKHMHRRRK